MSILDLGVEPGPESSAGQLKGPLVRRSVHQPLQNRTAQIAGLDFQRLVQNSRLTLGSFAPRLSPRLG